MAKTPRYKFKLPRKLYGRNISSIRAELDTLQPLSVQSDGRVWREPIQTSYGCACFHFSDESDNLNLVQFVLSSIQLEVGYGSGSISGTIKELEKNLELMKKIGELEKKYDLNLDYDYARAP